MKKILKNGLLTAILFAMPSYLLAENNSSVVSKGEIVTKSSNSVSSTWVKSSGLTSLGKELINQIKKDKSVAEDLPFYKLYLNVKRDIKKGRFSAKLNRKMDKLYRSYMNYLINGGIDWKAFDAHIAKLKKKYDYNVGWEKHIPPYSAKKILANAKLDGSFNDIFNRVEPNRFKYAKLKSNLVKFINIKHNGGWRVVKTNKTLNVGSSSSAIPLIRKRLKLEGDLNGCSEPMDSTVYDNCMAKAVKRFKLRHGSKGTSVIDRATRAEFRKPVSYYIKKMRLNLDRIKWSNRKEARVRIELNIPAFRLYVYDGKDLVTTMRVITGKPNHPTPVFSDVMTTIVVNPYWRIPESIVKKEMIKHLIKNPHYYEKQHKYLYDGWGPNSKKVNPATVNWRKYKDNKKRIPYHFMQSPSSRNALGKIKFLFPNKYSVYIHDTPGKRRFFNEKRAFSHGCMRIQKPRELLKALSLYNSNINVDSIMKKLKTDDNKQIGLRRRIPVDITYFTSFVDDYGNLHFRDDVYGYDRAQYRGFYRNSSSKAVKDNNLEKSKKSKKRKSNKKSVKNSNKNGAKKNKLPAKEKKPKYEVIEIGY